VPLARLVVVQRWRLLFAEKFLLVPTWAMTYDTMGQMNQAFRNIENDLGVHYKSPTCWARRCRALYLGAYPPVTSG
jgi:hypothetical protein